MKRSSGVFVVALALTLLALPAVAREGFGFRKKAVSMTRTIPPLTNAGARRVKVAVDAERGENDDDAQTLTRYISDAILAGAGTLAEGGRPELTITVALDRLDSHETWETTTENEYKQIGTKREYNEKKKKYEDKPVYGNVPVTKNIKVVEGSITGAWEISERSRDVANGSLDQETKDRYPDGTGAPAPSRVEDDLLKRAARAIAAQLVPTQDRVDVLLPRSTFEPFIPLAENGQWEEYLASVEATPARRDAKDEAYRQFALAVAKEALAYKKIERDEGLALLQEAVSHYETAIASNPGEELFRKGWVSLLSSGDIGEPATRAKASLARYQAWNAPRPSAPSNDRIEVASTKPSKPKQSSTAKPGTTAKQGMKNQTVIDLAKAGLADENIILAIDAAERTDFDLSPGGLAALAKSGVSRNVIAHMQRR